MENEKTLLRRGSCVKHQGRVGRITGKLDAHGTIRVRFKWARHPERVPLAACEISEDERLPKIREKIAKKVLRAMGKALYA